VTNEATTCQSSAPYRALPDRKLHKKNIGRGEEYTPAPALRSQSEQRAGPSPAS